LGVNVEKGRVRTAGQLAVILKSPTRQSRCGDGASEATKNLLSWNEKPPEQILRFAQDDDENKKGDKEGRLLPP